MATELRRRPARGKGKGKAAEDTIENTISVEDITPVRGQSPIRIDEEVKLVNPKRKRKLGAIFLLGSLFGIIAAGFFAKSNDLIDFPEIGDLSVDSLLDALPAGLVKDVRDLVVCLLVSSLNAIVQDDHELITIRGPERRARLHRLLRCLFRWP